MLRTLCSPIGQPLNDRKLLRSGSKDEIKHAGIVYKAITVQVPTLHGFRFLLFGGRLLLVIQHSLRGVIHYTATRRLRECYHKCYVINWYGHDQQRQQIFLFLLITGRSSQSDASLPCISFFLHKIIVGNWKHNKGKISLKRTKFSMFGSNPQRKLDPTLATHFNQHRLFL